VKILRTLDRLGVAQTLVARLRLLSVEGQDNIVSDGDVQHADSARVRRPLLVE